MTSTKLLNDNTAFTTGLTKPQPPHHLEDS